jgi:hypothetical protein
MRLDKPEVTAMVQRKGDVTGHLGLRLRIEQFQWFGVRLNAQSCPFNERFLLALGI